MHITGHVGVVDVLLELGADIHVKDSRNRTALHVVSAGGYDSIANSFISKGADLEIKDENGWTPLHLAALGGSRDAINVLIPKGADVNSVDNDGHTPLHLAILVALERGYLLGNRNLTNPALVRIYTNHTKWTGSQQLDIFEAFFQFVSRHDCVNSSHLSPLHIALLETSLRDEPQRFTIFVDPVDDGSKNDDTYRNESETPQPCGHTDEPAVDLFVLRDAEVKLQGLIFQQMDLLEEALKGNVRLSKFYLNNRKGPYTGTLDPLHRGIIKSILRGNEDTVSLIMSYGANINSQDNNGWTPLHIAVLQSSLYGNTEIVELLLSNGADVNLRLHNGFTALHIASVQNNVVVAELLLSKCAMVDRKDKQGYSPLFWANRKGNVKIVKLLIQNGANFTNIKDEQGVSPIHLAVKNRDEDLVNLILAKGGDINARTNFGLNPLDIAVWSGVKNIENLLRSKGAETYILSMLVGETFGENVTNTKTAWHGAY